MADKVPLWKQREDKYNAMSTKALEEVYKSIMDSRDDPKGIRLRTDLRPTTIRKILDNRKEGGRTISDADRQLLMKKYINRNDGGIARKTRTF